MNDLVGTCAEDPIAVGKEMQPRYLVISLGKSGSNWLNNILAALPGIDKFDMGAHKITALVLSELELLTRGSSMYTHVQYSPEFMRDIERLNIRAFYIYRDIRDSVVSEYFHKAYLDPILKEKWPVLKSVDDKTAFDFSNIMEWSTTSPYYDDTLLWMKESRIPKVKFEKLVTDPEESVRALLAFHNMSYTDQEIQAAISAASFKAMSGGREPGEEDRRNHYRKGIVGDWMNYFSFEQHTDLWNHAGAMLTELGYGDAPLIWKLRQIRRRLPADPEIRIDYL
ncbi:MAG: sulfotransferase domain-containing protein [Hyphomicrobium sp.]